jgi:hypothetical protein
LYLREPTFNTIAGDCCEADDVMRRNTIFAVSALACLFGSSAADLTDRVVTGGAIALIAGALLAVRFSALGLLPAVAFIGVVIPLIGLAAGGAVRHAVLAAVTAATALQFGFLGGVLIDVAGLRTRNERCRATGSGVKGG